MYLEIIERDIENWTTIPVTDYIETVLQGDCDQCGEMIPQEHGFPGFRCPEHGEIKQAEEKCPDCEEALKLNLGYYLIDGKITQHRKPYLLCGCNNNLWLTFIRDTARSMSKGENNVPIVTLEGYKWVHNMRRTQFIWDIRKEKLVKISKQHLRKLSRAKICPVEDYLKFRIKDDRQSTWYNKLLADTIELGVNIETLHPLLCQAVSSYWGYLNWPIKNSVREIIEHNPTNFYELISQKFETNSIGIRRILGGETDYKSGKRYKSPSLTIYTFNEEFTLCNTVKDKIKKYTQKYKQFHTNIINKCIAHCDAAEYESRKTSSHQDFIINIAHENIRDLCDIYNDHVLDSIEILNRVQNLDIELPYKITYGSLVNLNYEARQKLIELLSDPDKQVTRIREASNTINTVE